MTIKNIMVIGGGSGLGSAISHAELKKGNNVFILSSKPLNERIANNESLHHTFFDLKDFGQDNFLKSLDDLDYKIDKLYFCSIIIDYKLFFDITETNIDNEIKWNVTAPIVILQKVLKNNPNTHVIFILSHICFLFNRGFLVYRTIKKAMEAFLMGLEIEFPAAKITRVYPGAIDTEFAKNCGYTGLEFFKKNDVNKLASYIVDSKSPTIIYKRDLVFKILNSLVPFSLQKWIYNRLILK